MVEQSSRYMELYRDLFSIVEELDLVDIAEEIGILSTPVSEHVVWSTSAPGNVFCSRVENGDNGEVVSMPLDHVIANLSTVAGMQCDAGPMQWTNTKERRSTSKTIYYIENFTNVDCKPNPFSEKGCTWKTIRLTPLGPFEVELWKSNDDDRLFALIGFYVQFPNSFERICTITLDNAKEVAERELRTIAKEMYNPKLNQRDDTVPSGVA